MKSVLNIHWKDWCWNSNTLATWCEKPTHWKRLWCWEGLGARGEGNDKGWDGWMASLTRWTWVWVNSGSWWWTGRPGVLWFMGSQRVRHDWVIWSLIWSEWPNGFPYFLQFKPEFCNKEHMIWATMCFRSCFCWLYRASPFLAAKNIINLISVLAIWWCPCTELSLVLLEEGVCCDQCILLVKVCYPLPCFILYSKAKFACHSRQIWYLLASYFCFPVPCNEKNIIFGVHRCSNKAFEDTHFFYLLVPWWVHWVEATYKLLGLIFPKRLWPRTGRADNWIKDTHQLVSVW